MTNENDNESINPATLKCSIKGLVKRKIFSYYNPVLSIQISPAVGELGATVPTVIFAVPENAEVDNAPI